MALRIHRVKPPFNPPPAEPDAMYATKIRGILKPLHPFLVFEILKMDLATTVDFRIKFRDLIIEDKNLGNGQLFIFGTFPGFWFDRAQASNHDFQRLEMFKMFEQYVFKCLFTFVSQLVSEKSIPQRERMTIYRNGSVNWGRIPEFLMLITEYLRIFHVHHDFQEKTEFILIPKQCQTVVADGGLRKIVDEPMIWPMEICGFDKHVFEESVKEIAREKGDDFANWKLKQHLTNLLVQSLYYCTWRLDDKTSRA